MRETREQLLIKYAESKQAHVTLLQSDLTTRREFARAFGWNKPKKQYDYGDPELYEPTWIEIFVELGKILSARNFMDFEGNVSELEFKLEDLENKIRKEIHPNLT